MGYCKILSGGTDGRYNIELDFGQAKKAAILAALGKAINKNALDIQQAETEMAAAEAEEQIIAAILLALQTIIATGTPPERANATAEYQKQSEKLAQLKLQNEPLRYKLRQLKFVRASLRKQAQQFNLFRPIQRKQAWCADLTEDRAPGSYVGTIEVKGEPDLVLIQPGARAWIHTDGIVTGREIMSPWQAFWNAAVLPGWQKWKPTYRWGTLTAINRGANTATVALAAATSSAQRLGVNQESTLKDVPFSYMTCNHVAFDVDDRVIVQFHGQDWSSPRIVGFVDNPKACGWYCIGLAPGGYTWFRNSKPDINTLIYDNLLLLDITAKVNSTTDYSLFTIYDTQPTPAQFIGYSNYAWDDRSDPIDKVIVTFQVSGGLLHGIGVGATPPWPPVTNDPDPASNRQIVELIVRIGGSIVANFATTDGGWSPSAQEGIAYVRTKGGISYDYPPWGPPEWFNVYDLAYTLITD